MNKLSETDYNILTRISNKHSIAIDIKELGDEYYVSGDELIGLICELDDAVDEEKDRYRELENDLRENYEYKKVNPYSLYGVNERDFH